MNKKQAGIIVTLLALIVCAGILATKVNGPLEVAGNGFNEEGGILTFGNENTNTKKANETNSSSKSNSYFATAHAQKEQTDQQSLANLKAVVDDKSLSDEQKAVAAEKYSKMVVAQDQENKIAQHLKGKGYEDAICYLENDYTKARIILKTDKEELSENETKVIRDVVQSVAKISDVEVELRQ
ncbi:MAG: SpoIIIAH-like family protein [Clostridiales bacterium]|uniref:SpoIIIAH-like family protein n=1 Tax=Clostridium sp. N3C TaxID=1776758 RepID=UPI00092DEE5A|nr:SpoIIIAH-like family protein [Clostridium sp. N3C]NLZ47366.1 SpoIIIAH-like family protein [Clostridiales bacterium]SCN21379.1 SpoIIIAH-like protein [Clostridium sp. N3C]